MAGKLSPRAQVKLSALRELDRKLQHVHGEVERFAAAPPKHANMLALPLKRTLGRLKREFMGAGYDSLSQLCGSMEVAAGRALAQHTKSRILREGIGTLKFQVELEQRSIVQEDAAASESDDEAG